MSEPWTFNAEDHRNHIRVVYGRYTEMVNVPRQPETWWERVGAFFGREYTRPMMARPHADAIAEDARALYGERFMQVELESDDEIRTLVEAARALADAILADLSHPPREESRKRYIIQDGKPAPGAEVLPDGTIRISLDRPPREEQP